jgi:hypothetical protein
MDEIDDPDLRINGVEPWKAADEGVCQAAMSGLIRRSLTLSDWCVR